MSALNAAVESLIKAAELDPAEVKFVRIDTRRGTVQIVTPRGVHRFAFQLAKPKPAKRPAKKAAAKKTAKKAPAKKAVRK